MGCGKHGQGVWVGASSCICITHVLGCARVAIFKKQEPTSLSQRHSVNDLHILLSSKTFHDLFGNLSGKVQLFTFFRCEITNL